MFMYTGRWGEFDELLAGRSAAWRELLSWFQDPAVEVPGAVEPLAESEMESFVKFLRAW